MSLLNIFSGPSLEKLEKNGDELLDAGFWGQAKLAYERALGKAEKERLRFPDAEARILGKIARSKEALSAEHQKKAEDLMEEGYYDDARPLLSLAREITTDKARIGALDLLMEKLDSLKQSKNEDALIDEYYGLANDDDDGPEAFEETTLDEQFQALCGTLPPEVREAYLAYDEDFMEGYLALNSGDFETAAACLSLAMAADDAPGSYIPLELATAYLHLGRLAEARDLLEPFLEHHPESLPAYQLLCDICWEEKDFSGADALIDSIPEALADSPAVLLLRGETRSRAGEHDAARALYRSFLDENGWRDEIAIALAGTHEVSGENEKARNLYREIMGHCTGCGAKIDPEIKHKYAELSFSAGIYDTNVLEFYLALAQELPDRASLYYARASRIYTEQGNETEAARFRVFAKRSAG